MPDPDRLTVDTITSDQLDALYDQLDAYQAAEAYRQAAADTLVGRMDAIRQQTTEGLVEGFEQLIQRAEQAEAALVRVHHIAAVIHAGAPWTANHHETAARIRAAIATPAPAPAEATAPASSPLREQLARALYETLDRARRHPWDGLSPFLRAVHYKRADAALAVIDPHGDQAAALERGHRCFLENHDKRLPDPAMLARVRAVLADPSALDWRQRLRNALDQPTEQAAEPCPHCLGAPAISRTLMPDHIAQHHPHHTPKES